MISLPGWNSIEQTTKSHDFFEVAGIIFLALLVVAEVFAYMYGHQRDRLVAKLPQLASVEVRQAAEDAKRQAAELTKNRWDPLTTEEAAQIQEKLKGLDKKTILIFCKDSNCYDLADTFVQLFSSLHWTAKRVTSYWDLDDTEDGIKCVPDDSISQQIIGATTAATNGKLKMRIGTSVVEGDINIVIGRKTKE